MGAAMLSKYIITRSPTPIPDRVRMAEWLHKSTFIDRDYVVEKEREAEREKQAEAVCS